MEKITSQLELFSKDEDYSYRPQVVKRSFFSYLRGHERVILTFIGFLVTGIISFSLGVERGKKIASIHNQTVNLIDLAQKKTTQASTIMKTGAIPLQTQQALTTTNTKAAPLTQEQQLSSGSYTIQLASYMNTKDAQAAAQSLRKKGFTAVILTKGKYSVLCVGRFSNKEKAQALLSEFRKNSSYKDSFIRRL